ncbi:putative tryptophan transport protein [Oceanobacillus oncorhynchi subsp. incaldanensis]|uniref:Tryptophan transporter n=2 Tax=Oceanobacillus TaxID=182709 RepID=A0ABV9K4V4_9BACI|nr:tryptophan transporter [Oceanobacillus oncorhynchi]MDM8099501.1 tryptophan transporter [Oceanobacillus oncorhynchi]UUI38375.1 tryptophan transporter [Oceanobacillus oncorhynchi]GIO21105.1 putative tryptophan transport protein [Oceanobacillus oncorhynchi subsp. incaldanensis]CEI84054.1 putative tryptophan transport protein [Oceanobacillus oncorhynchi]
MKTKILTILALLVSIGTVLHFVMPPLLFGVKPDMMLAMMFLGIILFPKWNYVILLAFATGAISALTTAAPGGQIANLIDKPLTAVAFFLLFLLVRKQMNTKVTASVLTFAGTLISGSIFLSVALFFLGFLEGGFLALFAAVVLPAAVMNTVIMLVVYPIVEGIMKRSKVAAVS